MPRDLILDFRQGGGSVPEVPFGIVRIWGTEVRPNATSLVLTTETTLKLSEGKATLLNAQTSGTGPLYEWAYIIQVEPFHGRNFRFYVAIPDGTGAVNLKDLPKLNPYTGEGFYVSLEEWEALYGDLPDRVAATETKNTSQDTKITALEARPSGNATMRVDTTVGTRVFITDGVSEKMVSGDTDWRTTQWWGTDGVVKGDPLRASAGYVPAAGVSGGVAYRRANGRVYCRINSARMTDNYQQFPVPNGFYADSTTSGFMLASTSGTTNPRYQSSGATLYATMPSGVTIEKAYPAEVEWFPQSSWPISLPGTPGLPA